MMLSGRIHELFRDYEYLLICHTDAWIFRDELADWCRRGYDCVRSWVRCKVYDLPILKQYLRWRLRRAERAGRMIRQSLYGRSETEVFASPRGEFSGRAAKIRRRDRAVLFDGQPPGQRGCFLGPSFPKGFVILRRRRRGFAFDTNPAISYCLCGSRLPMGCHSWSEAPDVALLAADYSAARRGERRRSG